MPKMAILAGVSKRFIPWNVWQVFWDRHGHLSWLCQIICLKFLYWPVIFSTKNCPNPKSRLKFSVPSPTVVSVVSLTHQKNYPVYLSCERKLVSSLSLSLTYPILWHLDPSANFSFCILTRLQTHPLASWPVCKLFLWHLELSAKFSLASCTSS